jgi:hypothetical protein
MAWLDKADKEAQFDVLLMSICRCIVVSATYLAGIV